MSLRWKEISRFGKKTVSSGLTSSRFGNISVLDRDKIVITCTGSMLDELDERQIVEVDSKCACDLDRVASSETCVHREIYRRTSAGAVIHTHSPFAVALSLLCGDDVQPVDSEGRAFLGIMPIVEGSFGSEDLARNVSLALTTKRACIARGHGVFAAGRTLEEAYSVVCMAEHSSQVRYLVDAYRNGQGTRP